MSEQHAELPQFPINILLCRKCGANGLVVWEETKGERSLVLLACALAKKDDQRFFIPQSVVDPLASLLGKPVKIANFQHHLNEFTSKEGGAILIRRGKERAYKFRFSDPMLQPYIIMRGAEAGLVGGVPLPAHPD